MQTDLGSLAAGLWRELNAFRLSPLKAGVHGRWRFANDSLLRLQGQAVGGTDDAWRDAQVAAVSPSIRATPAAKIRGYAVLDVIGELPLAGGRFSIGIYNLADREYKTVYGQQAEATYGKISSVPTQGRTFWGWVSGGVLRLLQLLLLFSFRFRLRLKPLSRLREGLG